MSRLHECHFAEKSPPPAEKETKDVKKDVGCVPEEELDEISQIGFVSTTLGICSYYTPTFSKGNNVSHLFINIFIDVFN